MIDDDDDDDDDDDEEEDDDDETCIPWIWSEERIHFFAALLSVLKSTR